MSGIGGLAILASASSAVLIGLVVKLIAPPPRRLRSRLQPYLTPSLASPSTSESSNPVAMVFGPIVRDLADWLGRLMERGGDEVTVLKIRQAGWFLGTPEQELMSAYRVKQLSSIVVSTVLALGAGYAVGASVPMRVALLILGLTFGASRTKGQLNKAIEQRRERMKIEIYTVNQLLAMRVRAGGGVVQAVRAMVQRGSGEVITELADALRLHRAGWSGPDAFRRIAEITPEPFCSRTYRLLATAEERGADLATSLLALSEDVRETRRESIKRTATKRRAAMLVPTIAILAPVLILFVAAPLPYLITAWQ